MITFMDGGKEYRFEGEYRCPFVGEWFLGDSGEVFRNNGSEPWATVRAIVKLVPKTIEVGGVVFERTGEEQPVSEGEWYLNSDGDVFCWQAAAPSHLSRPIVRPIEVKHVCA